LFAKSIIKFQRNKLFLRRVGGKAGGQQQQQSPLSQVREFAVVRMEKELKTFALSLAGIFHFTPHAVAVVCGSDFVFALLWLFR